MCKTLRHTLRPDGTFDNPQTLVYLDRINFGSAFARNIEAERAAVFGATQRPVAVVGFGQPLQGRRGAARAQGVVRLEC